MAGGGSSSNDGKYMPATNLQGKLSEVQQQQQQVPDTKEFIEAGVSEQQQQVQINNQE